MRLTCLWRRRQIARCLLTSRPIDEDPGLKRHVERCRACSTALRDYECFNSVLHTPAPFELSADFNAKLGRRLAAAASDSSDTWERGRTDRRASAMPRFALGIACAAGLIVLAVALKVQLWPQDTENGGGRDRIVWKKPSVPASAKPQDKPMVTASNGQARAWDLPHESDPLSVQRLSFGDTHQKRRAKQSHRLITRGTNHGHQRRDADVDLQDAGSAVGARELFVSLVASPWSETGDAYAQIGDEPGARDAYAKEYERDGNVEAAIRAGEFSGAAGDRASELQYCALALTTAP